MKNLNSNVITITNIYNNSVNFELLISFLNTQDIDNYLRPINNLILTKIEDNIDYQCENITVTNYENLVINI